MAISRLQKDADQEGAKAEPRARARRGGRVERNFGLSAELWPSLEMRAQLERGEKCRGEGSIWLICGYC